MWTYKLFRRAPDSPRCPEEWLDALLQEGWESWCGRGAGTPIAGVEVYVVWLRRFTGQPGGPTREETLDFARSR